MGRVPLAVSFVVASSLAAVALAGCGGGGDSGSNPSDPHVAMGGHLFVNFACASCHGEQGKGGVSPDVPAPKDIGQTLAVAQLNSIINHGLGASANPQKPYMPVWGPVISTSQVSDLVSYVRAGLPKVKDADPVAVPRDQGEAVAGGALYVRDGCINCHGPGVSGGSPIRF